MVDILASERGVTIGGLHLEYPTGNLEDRNVEGAAAQVVHSDRLPVLGLHAEGQSCSRGLIDNPLYVEACNLSSILRSLALSVVEVSGHRHDSLRHCAAGIGLGGLLHLLEHERADLARRILLPGH